MRRASLCPTLIPGLFLVLAAATGCTPGDDTGPDDPDDTGSVGDVFDCTTVPASPEPETILEGVSGYKGLAFDDAGHIVGSDGVSLIKATRDGDWSVWIPAAGEVEGLAYLSDGDLISTYGYGAGEIRRYTPEGGQSVVVGGLANYAVVVAPNDRIYAAGWNGAFAIDPDSGAYTELFTGSEGLPPGVSPRILEFSRDYEQLFIGTIDNRGRVFVVDLDDDYMPVGQPQVFAEGLGRGWHDGLGIDICGQVYAVDYDSRSLYRASADGGEVTTLVDWSSAPRTVAHGLVFGTGSDGWRSDAIYLPEPENGNRVKEIVIGVPGQRWTGELVNGP